MVKEWSVYIESFEDNCYLLTKELAIKMAEESALGNPGVCVSIFNNRTKEEITIQKET